MIRDPNARATIEPATAPEIIFVELLRSVVIAVVLGVGAVEVADGLHTGVGTPESVAMVGTARGGVVGAWSATEVWVVSEVDVSWVDVVSGVLLSLVVVTSALVTLLEVGFGGSDVVVGLDVVVGSSCFCFMQIP